MFGFFVLLIVLASVLMCLIVLIQNSKGGGLASGFASSNQIMGVKSEMATVNAHLSPCNLNWVGNVCNYHDGRRTL